MPNNHRSHDVAAIRVQLHHATIILAEMLRVINEIRESLEPNTLGYDDDSGDYPPEESGPIGVVGVDEECLFPGADA